MATVNSSHLPVNRSTVDRPSSFPSIFPASRRRSSAPPAQPRPAKRAKPRPKSACLTAAGLSTLWHTLAKSAAKEAVRDDLQPGSSQIVTATISGDIDGLTFEPISVSAVLSVGHDSQRASTVTPDAPHLIASILAKLNTQTRDAILRDLPNEFEAAGCNLPEVSAELIERTEGMLTRLRAKQMSPVRGSVSVKYSVCSGAAMALAGSL